MVGSSDSVIWASDASEHLLHQGVDELLSVSEGAVALVEGVSLDLEASEGRGELEGPEEVVGLLELGAAGGDLVDEVLDAGDAGLSESVADDAVIGEGDSSSVDLSVSSLVNQLSNGFPGGVSVGHEGLNHPDHVPGGLVQLHEHAVVDLSQSQQLQDLLGLGGELVDTNK
eukprot:CAMPEP_0168624756 /NCGR_PEP_ID=MMETSP0449_2-20121227/9605_1 /TAXON_ID=1082188 /ORGANISM="Strombidium rassoulzadegani, Strain ras09" /LENGTH=170 /DNA_ID=CAMNT_0008666379 /DNA_START=99 /DNA_END=611 /DNA_ORIENTATION=-